MNGFLVHVLLFLAMSLAIVVMSSFYLEPEDRPALRAVPRRYLLFVVSCAAVAVVMLVLEHFFASVR
jgi:hypothetical protein